MARFTVLGAENPYGDISNHQTITADIVLTDRSSDRSAPVLYVLKQDLMAPAPDPRDAFLLLGPIIEHNRERKEIYLSNRTVVCYRSVVTFIGPKSGHFQVSAGEEFCPGAVLAIIDAIRCAPIRVELAQPTCATTKPTLDAKPISASNVDDKVHSSLLQPVADSFDPHALTDQWGQVKIKLYEVRL